MTSPREAKRNAERIVGAKVDKLGRAVGLEALRRIMAKTPVDTGRARANWNAAIGKEDPSTRDTRTDQAAAFQAGAAKIETFRMFRGDRLYITNGLPYIGRLEDGYSGQAPSGMVRLTVQELKPWLERQARRLRG